ncbi:MAG TPA: TonB-dependent receptor [Thermoanaerobaculia bacterium]|jgi:iron complex outermembrane receptor protein
MRRFRFAVPGLLAAVIALRATPTFAQTGSGRIAGTVRDPNGTPMAGAAVAITNQAGIVRVVRTTTAGTYEVTDLLPGTYTVTADVQGFRKVVRADQRVAASSTTTVDFALELRLAEDVTVTAMKRDQTVFDTPVSVAAPTEDDLRELGVTDIEGVANNVADFTVQNLGPGQSTVAIRGVSSGQIARDQPGVKEQVGAYLDESAISMSLFTPDMDLFDMNRVEVLRGPQGTLFGSGSVGGTVRYISNQPQLGASTTFGEAGGAAIDGGGTGGDFKAGFNAPLGDKVAFRMAAYYNRLAGWMDAVQPDLSIRPNVNAGDRLGVRAALTFQPIENLTITPRFAYQKVGMDGWNRFDQYNILANPFTTTRTPITLAENQLFTQIDEPFTDKFYLGDVKINWKAANWQITSITSFTNRDIRVLRDSGALTGSVTGGSIGEPESVYTLDAPLDDKTHASGFTQELRADGTAIDNRLHWLVGGFYSDGRRHYNQFLNVQGFEDLACNVPGGVCIPTQGQYAAKDELYYSDIQYKDREYGVFGEATFDITHGFSLTAGLRYYNYKVDKDLVFDGLFAPVFPDPTVELGKTTKADGVAPRFIASYKATEDIIINAQASKGFRLGGINDPILLPLCQGPDVDIFGNIPTWKDETAWNYELGTKMRFLNGKLSVNPTAFYIDVKNLQVVVTAGTCSSRLVFNVPKARSVGGELEVTYAPINNLDFSFSGSYNDSEVRESLSDEAATHATGIREGNRLPSVPKFQMAFSATYQQPISPTWWGYVTGVYQHVGDRYTQLVDQEPGTGIIPLQNVPGALGFPIGGPLTQDTFTFEPLLPSYDLVNIRLGIRHGVWDVAFYVNNLTNELAFLSLDRERGFRAREGFLVNQPRTFGIATRFDF